MKITVIGAGKMGSAILEGLCNVAEIKRADLYVLSGHSESTQKVAKKFKINAVGYLEDIKNSDLVINASPVNESEFILRRLGQNLKKDAVIISVAYGINLTKLTEYTNRIKNIVYMIPNLPVAVNEGVLAVNYYDEYDFMATEAYQILTKLGQVVAVKDDLIDVVSAGAGSGPAFVALMIEGLADGMVLHGMKREEAYQIIAKMFQGTASMLLQQNIIPAQLKDNVSSPGGSTIRGIAELESNSVRSAMIKVLNATIN